MLAPFTLLSPTVSGLLATAAVVAMVPATLLALDVRDWRCYACAFLWFPVVFGIQTANATLPLVLGLALVWRYRNRTASGALVAGLVIAVKLFFWPLLVWFVATRRYRSAALGAAASVLLVLVPWAGIGFAGLRGYPHLLAGVSRIEGPHSYSVAALLYPALPSWTAATAAETAIGLGILMLAAALGWRGRDRDAFALTIVAVLVLTPLVEMHYLAVLARRRRPLPCSLRCRLARAAADLGSSRTERGLVSAERACLHRRGGDAGSGDERLEAAPALAGATARDRVAKPAVLLWNGATTFDGCSRRRLE